jgi:hypothetical protein
MIMAREMRERVDAQELMRAFLIKFGGVSTTSELARFKNSSPQHPFGQWLGLE